MPNNGTAIDSRSLDFAKISLQEIHLVVCVCEWVTPEQNSPCHELILYGNTVGTPPYASRYNAYSFTVKCWYNWTRKLIEILEMTLNLTFVSIDTRVSLYRTFTVKIIWSIWSHRAKMCVLFCGKRRNVLINVCLLCAAIISDLISVISQWSRRGRVYAS